MPGFDHDFVVLEPAEVLLGRWLRRMKRVWPNFVIGAGDEIWTTARGLPSGYTGRSGNGFIVSRDAAMQEHTDRNGFIHDETGQSSISVWIVPHRGTGCHVDLVLPTQSPHPFTDTVLREFFVAVAQARTLQLIRGASGSRCLLSFDHPMAPDWATEALAVCSQFRLGQALGHGFELQCEPSASLPYGTRLRADIAPGAGRLAARKAAYLLAEVVGHWHTVKYYEMKTQVAYTCPPGRVVVREGRIDFEGAGGAYRFAE
jgi:hypothetical protein